METLADRITREGPLNELDAVGWAIRLAKRIESMHALGVTHGSISPQCVQIEGKDRTARAYLVDVRRTSSSLSFHSPERVNGGALSQLDDTWALACTLYAALTGSAPFSGGSDADVKQKVLASSPAPLAVFDVGDDDLQRVFDDAFSRDPAQRTSSVAALRIALEEWHPDPNVGGLPGLEDEDTEGGDDDDEEDARTIMRSAPSALLHGTDAARAASGPRPAAGAPAAPVVRAAPAPVPPPRASSPGGALAAPFGGLAPFGQPRSGPAARVAPASPGASPGFPAPAIPAPRASSPGGARAPVPSSPGGFPAPMGPPPELRDPPPVTSDDDEEGEDAKTMMRSVPEHLSAALGSRERDAGRSGAFAAVPPGKSGAFPSLAGSDDPDDAEDEATRMLPSPAFPAPADDDDDDEQKTLMRTSMPPDEVERIQAAGMPPPRPAAGAPADEPKDFASTVSFDALGLSSPVATPAASQGGLAGFAPAGQDPSSPAASAASAAGAFGAAAAPASAPMVIPGTGPMVAPPPPRRGALLWIALLILLIVAAGATFLILKMR